jgi:hypothetical protein
VPLSIANAPVVPDGSGVYAICVTTATLRELREATIFSAFCTALYVGQARGLRRRFSEHCAADNPDLRRGLSIFAPAEFWWCQMDPEHLNEFETRLIECFGPPANRVRGIQATLGPPRPA